MSVSAAYQPENANQQSWSTRALAVVIDNDKPELRVSEERKILPSSVAKG